MSQITPTEFAQILRNGAGGDHAGVQSDDYLDTPFDELGYDSLALLETVSRIERQHDVVLADDILVDVTTPRSFLRLVNLHLV